MRTTLDKILLSTIIIATQVFSAVGGPEKFISVAESKDSINKGYASYIFNDSTTYLYKEPYLFEFVPNVFRNMVIVPPQIIDKDALLPMGMVVLSTALLLYYDQEIIDASQRFGRFINLGTDNDVYNIIPSKVAPIYIPSTLPSALYYIGDGLTELSVNAGFFIYGKAKKDQRALRTASEITEGLCTVGIMTQLLKRITGHETPMRASIPGGRWRPFTPISEYQKSVPTYDAFPSGHLASAMTTTTIIALNYPEKKFVKPLCYSLMAVCGYQMMNNGVHWASDYPFAIAMGYAVGKTIVNRQRLKVVDTNGTTGAAIPSFKPSITLFPTIYENKIGGLAFLMQF